MKGKVREFLLLTLGTTLVAVGVYFFKFPNNFAIGGVTGISILLGNLIPSLTPGTLVLIINVLFLILGFIVLNRGFGVRTVYCSLLLSFLTWGLELVCPMQAPLTSQKLLELCYAVFFPAVGSAILFNMEGSTGGTDILAMILKKYTSLDIGKALLCSDFLITAATILIFGVETGLLSILGLMLKAFVVDAVIENINIRKSFTIVTTVPEKVCDYITHELHRGATIWEAQGAYTHEQKWVIITVMRRAQANKLRRYIKSVDPHSFMMITSTSEIIGKGFRAT